MPLGAGGNVEALLNFKLLATVGRQAAVGSWSPEEGCRLPLATDGRTENTDTHTLSVQTADFDISVLYLMVVVQVSSGSDLCGTILPLMVSVLCHYRKQCVLVKTGGGRGGGCMFNVLWQSCSPYSLYIDCNKIKPAVTGLRQ